MQNRKRKSTKDANQEDELLECEKKPRFYHSKNNKKIKVRNLLPIKVSSGKIVQQSYEEVEEDVEEEFESIVPSTPEKEKPKSETVKSSRDLLIERRKMIEQKKAFIARVASDIVADPQTNFRKIKQLRLMLEDRESPESLVTIRKLATASLGCLFVDIIPGYRIRERTEKEKQVKLSKEVKALTDFEEGLLCQYQLFLKLMEKMIQRRIKPGKSVLISPEASRSLGEVAIHALADLFKSTSHFNYHANITMVLVRIANDDKDPAMRKLCCDAMATLFGDDKQGAPSLTAIKAMARLAKDRGPRNIKSEFLNTLLGLRIKNVDYSMIGVGLNKAEKEKKKEAKKMMSRRERKHLKKQQGLHNELKEIAATEDKDERTKIHTEIVQQIFLIYFRILKHKNGQSNDCRAILPAVLEGLAKYSHLINIDFFGDLLKVLQQLISTGTLTERENLHCIFTVFQILSGQGEVINVDPVEFYKIMYKVIPELATQRKHEQQNLDVMIRSVHMMLNKRRKQITLTSLCAFIKRLMALAMQLRRPNHVVSVLNEVGKLLDSNSKTSSLFDAESSQLGTYQADMEDPVHSKGHCAVMWELHLMRRHYVPLVSQSAKSLLKRASK